MTSFRRKDGCARMRGSMFSLFLACAFVPACLCKKTWLYLLLLHVSMPGIFMKLFTKSTQYNLTRTPTHISQKGRKDLRQCRVPQCRPSVLSFPENKPLFFFIVGRGVRKGVSHFLNIIGMEIGRSGYLFSRISETSCCFTSAFISLPVVLDTTDTWVLKGGGVVSTRQI